MKYGLIGEKLSHSYSKIIHELLGSSPYELVELSLSPLNSFMKERDFTGINVTVPFKEAVIPLCDEVDEKAQQIGAVNTIINKNGRLIGYNTDYMGFSYLLDSNYISVSGKNVLILGSGGTSKTASAVISDRGGDVIVVSRTPKDKQISYSTAKSFSSTDILINTTPVGMYPNCDAVSFNIRPLTSLTTVIDVIYNPATTMLLKRAKKDRISAYNGLDMLVAQAFYAAELFLGQSLDKEKINEIKKTLTLNERGIR